MLVFFQSPTISPSAFRDERHPVLPAGHEHGAIILVEAGDAGGVRPPADSHHTWQTVARANTCDFTVILR